MDRISWIRSKAEGKVLDVGCAGGENFKGTRFEVIYTDINEFPLPNFMCADAHHLPFNDNSFDSVVLGELLEHVTNPLQVLKEATRVSRKKVIFTVPNEFAWPVQLKPFMPLA
ncbi:unnamed protein product [marine sediment metagenome]|uniref:Methyltransferase type 11 domain-containing protein n=1 Tax=marine sediment metagenome TaxID=412755 RepID=X1TQ90_9ZZZZ